MSSTLLRSTCLTGRRRSDRSARLLLRAVIAAPTITSSGGCGWCSPLHTTTSPSAQLTQSHLSITPGATMQLPPAVPIPIDPSTPSAARSALISHPRPNPSGPAAQVVAKSPTPISKKLDHLESQGRDSSGVDLGSIVALDLFLLRTLGQLVFEAGQHPSGSGGTAYIGLSELAKQSRERNGAVLDQELSYESTPTAERKVQTTRAEQVPEGEPGEWQSGIVTVAHVVGGKQPRVSVCSGFAIGDSETIVTCGHTLEAISHHLDPSSPSISLILTASGHVYPVTSLLSSLPSSDLLLLSIPPTPLRNPSYRLPPQLSPESFPKLRPLPISPYPAPVGTKIACLEYSSPLMGSEGRQLFGWKEGTVIEYKDEMGRTAETGTYDSLSTLRFSSLPSSGSSGGPIVDTSTGAVIGVIRGSTSAYGDRQERGFGTPAEKMFEWFQLPGFRPSSTQRSDASPSTGRDVNQPPSSPQLEEVGKKVTK